MLKTTLNRKHGLINGAKGILKNIVLLPGKGKKVNQDMPDFIVIFFPQYTGEALMQKDDKLVAITPITSLFKFENTKCERI